MKNMVYLICTIAFAIAPASAGAQKCVGEGTATMIEHNDGSRTRVETDKNCNHVITSGVPMGNGAYDWHEVGQRGSARSHSEVVKDFKLPGSREIAVTDAPPSPTVRGLQGGAQQAPAQSPKTGGRDGDGAEGGSGLRGGGATDGGGGIQFGPALPGDSGITPGGSGIRPCKAYHECKLQQIAAKRSIKYANRSPIATLAAKKAKPEIK